MKEYKAYITQCGTVVEYLKVWVEAENEEEARQKILNSEWVDYDVYDTQYDGDFGIEDIDEIIEIKDDED